MPIVIPKRESRLSSNVTEVSVSVIIIPFIEINYRGTNPSGRSNFQGWAKKPGGLRK